MCVERYLRLAAGSLTLISLLLAHFVSGYFLLFTAFIGLNLLQSAFTNWCPMMSILRGVGVSDCDSARKANPKAPASGRPVPHSL